MHDLKHTRGRRLRAAGVGLEDGQDILAHKSGRMTKHYGAAEFGNLWRSSTGSETHTEFARKPCWYHGRSQAPAQSDFAPSAVVPALSDPVGQGQVGDVQRRRKGEGRDATSSTVSCIGLTVDGLFSRAATRDAANDRNLALGVVRV